MGSERKDERQQGSKTENHGQAAPAASEDCESDESKRRGHPADEDELLHTSLTPTADEVDPVGRVVGDLGERTSA